MQVYRAGSSYRFIMLVYRTVLSCWCIKLVMLVSPSRFLSVGLSGQFAGVVTGILNVLLL